MNLIDLQIGFNKWNAAVERIAHAENDAEREQLQSTADKLAQPWASEYPQDWQYLGQLREQWRTDPDGVRADIQTHTRARHAQPEIFDGDSLDARKHHHMSYTQFFYDPIEQERRDWYDMHNRRAELNGELAAARSDAEIDAIQARIAEMNDQTHWPQSWKDREAEVAEDLEFWHEQSERASEHYSEILKTRAAGESHVFKGLSGHAFAAGTDREGIDR
ncbi:hypothetical protein [Nocardia sp. NPDC050435]|uniref:hypothetical protein n=1 Tax=Nocardia sp. NPDC050435 TaxID=3155040 RepID=UPI0033FD6418